MCFFGRDFFTPADLPEMLSKVPYLNFLHQLLSGDRKYRTHLQLSLIFFSKKNLDMWLATREGWVVGVRGSTPKSEVEKAVQSRVGMSILHSRIV